MMIDVTAALVPDGERASFGTAPVRREFLAGPRVSSGMRSFAAKNALRMTIERELPGTAKAGSSPAKAGSE